MDEWLASYAYLALALGAVGFSAWRWRKAAASPRLRFWLLPALAVKLLAGVAVGTVYLTLYAGEGGDTFSLFSDAAYLNHLLLNEPETWRTYFFEGLRVTDKSLGYSRDFVSGLNPRSLRFVRLLSLVNLLSGNDYWLMALWLSLFSFWGQWFCVGRLARHFPGTERAALLSFLILPSVVFWSAGVLKESVSLACLGFIVGHALDLIYGKPKAVAVVAKALAIAVASCFLLMVKYYYLAAMMPALFAWLLTHRIGGRFGLETRTQVGIYLITYASILYVATYIHPNLRVAELTETIATSNAQMTEQTERSGNLIRYPFSVDGSLGHALANAPAAAWQAMARPYLWEARHAGHVVRSIEAMAMLALLAWALIKKPYLPNNRLIIPLIASVLYCCMLLVLLALAVPNLGNLIRYASAFLPFLSYIALTKILSD